MQRWFLSGAGALGFLTALLLPAGPAAAADTWAGAPEPMQTWSPAVEYSFGLRYQHGDGVPKNLAYAAYWFHAAASAGEPRAQLAMAICYGSGSGVPRDHLVGYAWANIAAANLPPGSEDWRHALYYRKLMKPYLTGGQVATAQQMASDWRPGLPGPIEAAWWPTP